MEPGGVTNACRTNARACLSYPAERLLGSSRVFSPIDLSIK